MLLLITLYYSINHYWRDGCSQNKIRRVAMVLSSFAGWDEEGIRVGFQPVGWPRSRWTGWESQRRGDGMHTRRRTTQQPCSILGTIWQRINVFKRKT